MWRGVLGSPKALRFSASSAPPCSTRLTETEEECAGRGTGRDNRKETLISAFVEGYVEGLEASGSKRLEGQAPAHSTSSLPYPHRHFLLIYFLPQDS